MVGLVPVGVAMMTTLISNGPVQAPRIDKNLLIFLAFVLIVIVVVHLQGDAAFDFGVFYVEARMVLEGARGSLYDVAAQHLFHLRYHRPPELLFYNPPFALLPLVPLAVLPIQAVFALWTALSLALLIASVRSLAARTQLHYGNWPLMFSLVFLPVSASLGQGQFSAAVLAAYVWCYALFSDKRPFAGGMVLALACCKFQLVLGFACILLLKRKWRELAGLATGCVPLLLISALMVGVRQLLQYPRFLLHAEGARALETHADLVSLRGLTLLLLGDGDHTVVVLILSIVTLFFAASLWKDLDTGFSAAILATLLVSYHGHIQDLSLVLIPVAIGFRQCAPRLRTAMIWSALLLPLAAYVAGQYYAPLAVPLIAMFFWIRSWGREPLALYSAPSLRSNSIDTLS